MRVKLRTLYATSLVVAQPGSVIDVDPDEAAALVKAGAGEILDRPVEPPAETAAEPLPQRPVKRR